jgi:hypothetical protein
MLRGSLPLEGDWSEVWLKIDKVIDQLHIKNHKVEINLSFKFKFKFYSMYCMF